MKKLLSQEYTKIQNNIMNYIKKYVSNYQDVEDIFQETVFTLLNKKIDIKDTESLEKWILKTAKNHILNYYRKKKLEVKRNLILPNDSNLILESSEKVQIEQAEDKNMSILKNSIKKMNDNEYAIIYLWKVEKLTLTQIAKTYGVSRKTIHRTVDEILKYFF